MSGYHHVLCVGALFAVVNSNMLGPVDLQLKRVEQCPAGESYKSWLDITQRRLNRTTEALDFNASFHTWMDDQVGIYISIDQLLDGGYKKAYEIREEYACEFFMKHLTKFITTVFQMAGLEEKCPVPPGSYLAQNYMLDLEKFPPMLYGDFLADVQFLKDDKPILCIRMHIITRPKDRIRYVG